jgi:hypothetical protein
MLEAWKEEERDRGGSHMKCDREERGREDAWIWTGEGDGLLHLQAAVAFVFHDTNP